MQVDSSQELKGSFFAFMNEKIAKAQNEKRSIWQSYLNNMTLLKYDTRNEKKERAEQAAARGKRLALHILKRFE